MADVRVTTTRGSRQKGDVAGIQLNTFGLQKLADGVNGEEIARIMLEAAQPMFEQCQHDWYDHWFNFDTGASADSVALITTEVEERRARIQLQAGGEVLRSDPRNKSHQDYAPMLEYHEGGGMIRNAVFDNQEEFVRNVHAGIKRLVEELIR